MSKYSYYPEDSGKCPHGSAYPCEMDTENSHLESEIERLEEENKDLRIGLVAITRMRDAADDRVDELKAENAKLRSLIGDEFDAVACDAILTDVEQLRYDNDHMRSVIGEFGEELLADGPTLVIERLRKERDEAKITSTWELLSVFVNQYGCHQGAFHILEVIRWIENYARKREDEIAEAR